MSCQGNSVKAKAATAAAGASRVAGKAAYAAGVSAGAVGSGALGGVGGAAGGAVMGAVGGGAAGLVAGPPGMVTGAVVGAGGGALGGAVMGGVGGARLGAKGVRQLAGRQPPTSNDGRLTRQDRTVIRTARLGGAMGMAWVGGTMGGMAAGPVGGVMGAVGGAVLGGSSLGPAGRAERHLKLKRWRESDGGRKAKTEFMDNVKMARQSRRPGLKGQLGYFKQVANLQREFDARATREALS